jgi:hypothetical protein
VLHGETNGHCSVYSIMHQTPEALHTVYIDWHTSTGWPRQSEHTGAPSLTQAALPFCSVYPRNGVLTANVSKSTMT